MNYRLYNGSDAHAWHSKRWPQFSHVVEHGDCLVIQPIYSITSWAGDFPLDAEEVIGAALLDAALALEGAGASARVLPPLRYTPALSAGTCFGLDVEVAHRILEDTLLSAAMPGYRRFVLYNTSPLLEEWIDVAGRDLRVEHDLQVFGLNLAGLGLDFHPERGGHREVLRGLLRSLLGSGPLSGDVLLAGGEASQDPLVATAVSTRPPREAHPEGPAALLAEAAAELAGILKEIREHPPLRQVSPNAEAGL